jgi:hypothetical protein
MVHVACCVAGSILACDAQLTEIIRLIGSVTSEDIMDMPTSRKQAG